MATTAKQELTLGPILFHWPEDRWRDFYFRIADEAPVDTVYIGEVVCSKRAPFYEPLYPDVAKRLQKGGKKVVFSTLAEVTVKLDRRTVENLCVVQDTLVEANDASALWHLSGRPHSIGQMMNVYSEDTLAFLAAKGARHFCLPAELPGEAIATLGAKAKDLGVTLEVQVYGRIPLALSARCYHARAHGRTKDSCQFVCEQDPNGMTLKTLTGKPFLAINGIQTLSYTCLNLVQELSELAGMGVNSFRLSPHTHDMVRVAAIFRDTLDGKVTAKGAAVQLEKLAGMPFSNGFYHKTEGCRWVEAEKRRA
ncbi:MAG: U32 family peptidase [Alphaproteobacteria bacterium]|nr:MAG: U32 family peptidase [Alphaproteobacteria bacterium]